jgi:hypothetical protein
LLPAGVLDELKLRFILDVDELKRSLNSSKTPAGSNVGEHYQIL